MKREIRRIRREFTPEELAEWKRMVAEVEAEKDEIVADARMFFEQRRQALARLNQVLQLLRAERERQGLSLSDLQERTGIDRSALSRLENGKDANPTISTLQRYAEALGKEVAISLIDREEAKTSGSAFAPTTATGCEDTGQSSPKKERRLRAINLDAE